MDCRGDILQDQVFKASGHLARHLLVTPPVEPLLNL